MPKINSEFAEPGSQPFNIQPPFTLARVSVGLNNVDYFGRHTLAEAFVSAGPFRVRAFLAADSSASLPGDLRDDHLRAAIRAAMRTETLAELGRRLAALTDRDNPRPAGRAA